MAAISAYDKINYSQLKLPSFEELAMAPAHLTKKHEEAEDNLAAITSEATKAEMLAMENPESFKKLVESVKQIIFNNIKKPR